MDISDLYECKLIYALPTDLLKKILAKSSDLKKLHNNNKYDTMFNQILYYPNSIIRIANLNAESENELQKISNAISEILMGSIDISETHRELYIPTTIKKKIENGEPGINESLLYEATRIAAELPSKLEKTFENTKFYKTYATKIKVWKERIKEWKKKE